MSFVLSRLMLRRVHLSRAQSPILKVQKKSLPMSFAMRSSQAICIACLGDKYFFVCPSDGSSLCDLSSTANENSFALDMDINTKFSVWVSFCEIYNENIHDLLEQNASNASRRTNLRLCQDVKGNSFIKGNRRPAAVFLKATCSFSHNVFGTAMMITIKELGNLQMWRLLHIILV